MKALRYLLITFAVMMVMSVSAQSLAQEPQIGFQSTSSMVGSGSTLPQAAQYGVYTTYDQGYSASRANKPGVRRVDLDGDGIDDDTTENEDENTNIAEPFPIGDGMWAMVLLACAYVIFRYVRTRKGSHVAAQR
jgi:hypothetical protein